MKTVKHWKGPVTFTRREDKKVFSLLHWLARAVSTDPTRYSMHGIYSEIIDGNRVFVATDGRQLHKAAFPGNPKVFAGIPTGKIIGVKADSKQVIFTEEIDGSFPNYKAVIPDIAEIKPFHIQVYKNKYIGYTEALYDLYSRGIKINALHIQGLEGIGDPEWEVYHAGNTVVCIQKIPGAVCAAVCVLIRE
jgi:hypothetical protein